MAVITFSDTIKVARFRWIAARSDLSFGGGGVFGSQSVRVGHPRWGVVLESPDDLESSSGEWASLIMNLDGQLNQLELWNLGRAIPRGRMRGTMTLNSAAAQGATSLEIVATGQNGKTLLRGDYLGIGSLLTQHLLMVTADATSDGSGVISVTTKPPLRDAFSAGEEVRWDRPKALFRNIEQSNGWDYSAAVAGGFSLQLTEDWRP